MTSDPFAVVYAQYTTLIRTLAIAIAKRDLDLADDLHQEGAIALWRIGPEKWDQMAYCKAVIRSRMINYRYRKGRPVEEPPRSSRGKRQTVRKLPRPSRRERRTVHHSRHTLRPISRKHRDAV